MQLATVVVAPEEFDASVVEIRSAQFRHLFRVRRLQVGDQVRLVDGKGHARRAVVSEVLGSSATVRTSDSLPSNESPLRLEVVVPVPRSPRLTWLVEKCTEVGVAAIRLIRSQRAPRGLGQRSLERLNRVAQSAVEQSNRARVPEISGVHRWEDLEGIMSSCHRSYFLQPGGSSSTLEQTVDSVVLLVGPEGGWSPEETSELVERCSGQLNLGPRTLRIETAAVTGAALFLGRD